MLYSRKGGGKKEMETEGISIIDKNNRIKIPDKIISHLGIQKEIIIERQNKKIYLKKP